jgi:hypothetical protein
MCKEKWQNKENGNPMQERYFTGSIISNKV